MVCKIPNCCCKSKQETNEMDRLLGSWYFKWKSWRQIVQVKKGC